MQEDPATLYRSTRRLLAALPMAALALPAPASADTITVTTELDEAAPDGQCSLREAIAAANEDVAIGGCPAGFGSDRIDFELATPATIVLTSDLPAITTPLAIHGPGIDELEIDGDSLYRPIDLAMPSGEGWLLVEDLSLVNGWASEQGGGARVGWKSGAAVFRRVQFLANTARIGGGGLSVERGSAATIVDCTFADNVAEGAIGGGGLLVTSDALDVRIVRSTFTGNRVAHDHGTGGAVTSVGPNLTLEASTVSGNTAYSSGGGIFVEPSSADVVVTLRDSTVTGNVSAPDFGGGAGIEASSTTVLSAHLVLENTVVAGNSSTGLSGSDDLFCGGTLFDLTIASSFVGSNAGCQAYLPSGNPNLAGNFVGTGSAPLRAFLRPLDDDGGVAPTHAPSLNPLSPLIDHGRCAGSVADQRGYGDAVLGLRAVDLPAVTDGAGSDGCDIGAMEVGADPQADPQIFADGFESGNTLMWIVEIR